MRPSNKIFIITLLIAIACAAVAVKADAETTGCCLNAKTWVCSTPVTEAQCCPENANSYGVEGAPNRQACIDRYFKPGNDCTHVINCTIGCCCNPLPLRSVEPACRPLGIWTEDSAMDTPCDKEYCKKYNESFPHVTPPDYLECPIPAPVVQISHVKGQKFVGLTFSSNCDYKPDSYKIERRELPSGVYQEVVKDYKGGSYVDEYPLLKWDKEYRYKVTATYLLSGNRKTEQPAEVSIKLGDTICWGAFTGDPFCVAPNFFSIEAPDRPRFIPYFRDTLGTPAASMNTWINNTFRSNFYNGYVCNASNKARVNPNCAITGKTCVIDSTLTPQCYARGSCEGVHPFGMFTSTSDECEKEGTEQKYCFFDKSLTLVNKCYECSPQMDCYDYKSEAACEADNCHAAGVKSCSWNWTNQALGIGVCVAEGKDNCKFCDVAGTSAVDSSSAHNFVFNRCTQEKLNALSVDGFPCGTIGSLSCRDFICEGITQQSSCANRVQLGDNNQFSLGSSLCDGQIKGCLWYPTKMRCVKDANGDGAPDCADTQLGCQRDRYAPRTELVSTVQLSHSDNITFRIFDKIDSQGVEQRIPRISGGYRLYFCSYNDTNECGRLGYNGISSSSESYFNMTKLSMNVGDLIGLERLKFGDNNLKFFAVDPNKNVEVIKTARIRVSTRLEGGIGIALLSPLNNSYVNNSNPLFRIRAESVEKLRQVLVRDLNGVVVKEYYCCNAGPKVVDKALAIALGNAEGWKTFIVDVAAEFLPPRQSRIRVYLDKTPPATPTLVDVPRFTETNQLKLSGTGEIGSTIKLYVKLGTGQFEYAASAIVIPSGSINAPRGKFNLTTPLVLQSQGDYKVKARAYDLAKNPSLWSNQLNFTFVSGAPTFEITPPDGAIRPAVRNVTVYFTLWSEFVPLNKTATKIEVSKEGIEILGNSPVWNTRNTTLAFFPAVPLTDGQYTIKVTSVDKQNHKLIEFSGFRVNDEVPRIVVTSWVLSSFKVKEQQQWARGYIEGPNSNITRALISVKPNTAFISILSIGSMRRVNFEKYVTLVEGQNFVVINATNALGNTAREPFEVELDRNPPGVPKMGFR